MDLLGLFENPISLFDCSLDPSTKKTGKEIGLTELMCSIKETSDTEDYLKKSEKLTTLAKEWYQKEHKKLSLSTAQEKLFHLKFSADDKKYFSELLHTLAVKVVRPCLRSMESADDAYAKAILDMIAPCFHIKMEITKQCRYFERKQPPFLHLLISEDGVEGTSSIWGLKNATHAKSKHNVHYTSGEMVADVGELLSLFLVLSIVITSMKNPEDRAYLEQRVEAHDSGFPYSSYEETFYTGNDWKQAELVYLRDRKWDKEISPSFLKYLEEHFTLIHSDLSETKWKEHCQKEFSSERQAIGNRPALFLTEKKAYAFYAQNFFSLFETIGIRWKDFRGYQNERYWALPFYYQLEQSLSARLMQLFFFWLEKHTGEVKMLEEYAHLDSEYARSFEQKKNIPAKTLTAMQSSRLNHYFGFVEFDEMVDLSKVQELTQEFCAFKDTYFPGFSESEKCAIRFRRLYNHKAIGLYYPGVKCLCVDVRNPQSFVHEYGHLLDFCAGDLSLSADFASIRCLYEAYMDRISKENQSAAAQLHSKGKYNRDYYCMPTEIFARSMEIYFSILKEVRNSMLPSAEELEGNFAYPVKNTEYLKAVENYFDLLLSHYALKKAG